MFGKVTKIYCNFAEQVEPLLLIQYYHTEVPGFGNANQSTTTKLVVDCLINPLPQLRLKF